MDAHHTDANASAEEMWSAAAGTHTPPPGDDNGPEGSTEGATDGANTVDLSHLVTAIKRSLATGQRLGLQALTDFRDIGDALLEAKAKLESDRGAFGKWVDVEFGFSKEWRARLMKLATNWGQVLEALKWAASEGRILGRKEYSVDGALALVAEWVKAMDPTLAEEAAAKAREKAEAKARADGAKAEAKSEAEQLREALQEALRRIKALEEALNKARAGSKGGTEEAHKGKAKATEDGPKIPASVLAKARKVHALYKAGGTDGEKAAARDRLDSMAMSVGLHFEAFMAACKLEV